MQITKQSLQIENKIAKQTEKLVGTQFELYLNTYLKTNKCKTIQAKQTIIANSGVDSDTYAEFVILQRQSEYLLRMIEKFNSALGV